MHGLAGESGGGRTAGWQAAAVECVLIFLAFAAAGAWPTPDVNEAVYLTKARHAANPAWGRGDFFLETPDAHGVFYLVMGPLAASMPLDQAAWIGRVAGWVLLAIGFRGAVVPLVANGWARVLAALLFSFAVRNTTAAGEWVIGGCEAKVFAWAAVFGGLGSVAAGRFPAAVLSCGVATAFHPIVGGWALLTTAATWLAGRIRSAMIGAASPGGSHAGAFWVNAALVVGGMAMALVGVVPAIGLSANADEATRSAANEIYVVDRLSHHLLPRTFADGMIARHVLTALVWWLLSQFLPPTAPRRRIMTFTGVALAISVVGLGLTFLEAWAPATAYALLRFYWFRLADVMVPFALATTLAAGLEDESFCRRLVPVAPAWLRAAAFAVVGVDLAVQSCHWPLPQRTELAARADSKVAAAAWADVCDWVREHCPEDACFLTPLRATSFTWRTGRREVVSWKNSPQDAASLVEWRRRIVDCFSRTGSLAEMERSTAALGPDRVGEMAARYGADHVIVPLDTAIPVTVPGDRLYENGTYAVYRLTNGIASR